MNELQARARLANVRVSGDAPPAVPNVDQSALKARDLGDAFAHPDSPVPDRKPSGLTLMSNSPDAFKGREIRVSHAAGARFDDHTTNRDSFVPHEVSPAPYGNGARKQYAPSYVKFDGMTTNAHDFVPHPVLPSPAVARKPYRMYEAKFDDETTNRAEFPAHEVVSPSTHSQVRKQYAPSGVNFDGVTTNAADFHAHTIAAKRPPVGLWVENDRTEILIHAGRELPARATRVFSTTEKNQSSVAVRIVQGFSRRASENEVLGVFEMAGIAPGPRGSAQIKITFSMDEKGVLTVEGTDLETRQVQTTQTQTRDK